LWQHLSQSNQERLGAIAAAIQQGGTNVPQLGLRYACVGSRTGQDVLIGIDNDGLVVHLQNTAISVGEDGGQSVTAYGIKILSLATGNLNNSREVVTQRKPLSDQFVPTVPDVKTILSANTSQVLSDMERAAGALCPNTLSPLPNNITSPDRSTLLTWSFLGQGPQNS
jgi:hypothetical protein